MTDIKECHAMLQNLQKQGRKKCTARYSWKQSFSREGQGWDKKRSASPPLESLQTAIVSLDSLDTQRQICRILRASNMPASQPCCFIRTMKAIGAFHRRFAGLSHHMDEMTRAGSLERNSPHRTTNRPGMTKAVRPGTSHLPSNHQHFHLCISTLLCTESKAWHAFAQ